MTIERSSGTGGTVIQVKGDNNTIIAPHEAVRLFQDREVRRALRDVLDPLEEEGIEVFEARDAGRVVERVSRKEITYFDPPPPMDRLIGGEEIISVNRQRLRLEIVGVVFDKDLKWKFFDGESRFQASISDRAFWANIERHEDAFGMGDELVVELVSTQKRIPRGLTIEHDIERVYEHIRAPKQTDLFDDQ